MDFFAFFTYVILTTYTPGPNNLMSMASGNLVGFRRSIGFTIGVGVGFFLVLMVSLIFNRALMILLPRYGFIMRLVGAGYILWLAYHVLMDSGDSGQKYKAYGFSRAILLQFINPKGIFYAITLCTTFLLPHYQDPLPLVLFSAMLGLISISSCLCWAAFGSVLKRFMAQYRKPFNVVMALLLVYVAYSILRS